MPDEKYIGYFPELTILYPKYECKGIKTINQTFWDEVP